MAVRSLIDHPRVDKALTAFKEQIADGVALAIDIQQIPAPTFAEEKRARWLLERFRAGGLVDTSIDEVGNVYGRLPGTLGDDRPVVLSAHIDTVFPAETDLSISRNGSRIFGPGIADNSMGVAGLLWLMASLREFQLKTARDLWFVANVGEEGLGDLNGMRAVAGRFGALPTYIVIEGGSFGHIIHQGIGVKRYQISVQASGGHSWADFGQTSAIHILGKIIAEISALEVPVAPKTTFNVGVITGGTSINTIAESANFLLDLRSEGAFELETLVNQVARIVGRHGRQPRVQVEMVKIGDRPAGGIPRDHPLIQEATTALAVCGRGKIEYGASSTDANIPLSLGAEAVCIGLAESGNVHRLNEYLDTRYMAQGMSQLLLLTLSTAGLDI